MAENVKPGNFVRFVCFDCATIESEFIPNLKAYKKFKQRVISSDCCSNCKGRRFYLKDQFGNTLEESNENKDVEV